MKKYIFFLLLLFFVVTPFLVFSQEIVYPSIPGVAAPQEFLGEVQSQGEILPLFMQYFFGLFLIVSIAVAFLVILYGGIIYILASDNPDKRKSGKSWILGALQGTLIIFASYALLYTLDSQLVLFQQRNLDDGKTEEKVDLKWEIKNVYYQIPFGLLIEDAILNETAQSKLYDVLDATYEAEDTSDAIEEGSKQLLEIIKECPEDEPCCDDDGKVNSPPTKKKETPKKRRDGKTPSWVTELFTPGETPGWVTGDDNQQTTTATTLKDAYQNDPRGDVEEGVLKIGGKEASNPSSDYNDPNRDGHYGTDFAANDGDAVQSPFDGEYYAFVDNCDTDRGCIIITKHELMVDGKKETVYMVWQHLNEARFNEWKNNYDAGDEFNKGDTIAHVGSTGVGPAHLHVESWVGNKNAPTEPGKHSERWYSSYTKTTDPCHFFENVPCKPRAHLTFPFFSSIINSLTFYKITFVEANQVVEPILPSSAGTEEVCKYIRHYDYLWCPDGGKWSDPFKCGLWPPPVPWLFPVPWSICCEHCKTVPTCTEGEKICSDDGGAVYECIDSGWNHSMECGEGEVCEDGECVEDEEEDGPCEDGDVRCNDDGIPETCKNGEWIAEGECAEGEKCEDGECVEDEESSCADLGEEWIQVSEEECPAQSVPGVPESVECQTLGKGEDAVCCCTDTEFCLDEGCSIAEGECPEGTEETDNMAEKLCCCEAEEEGECEPGEKQCEGDIVMVCTDEGVWEEEEDCKENGEEWVCEDGECVMPEPCPACPDIAPAVQAKIAEIEGHMAQLSKDLDELLLTKEPIKEDLYQLYKVVMLKSLGYKKVFGYNSLLLERRYYEREEVVIDTDREVSQVGKYTWDWSQWINNLLYRMEISGKVIERNDPVTFYLRMPESRKIVEDALRLAKEAKARDIQTIKSPLGNETTTSLNVFQRVFSLVTGIFSNTVFRATLTPAHTPGEFVTCGMEIPVGEIFELTWDHLIELLDTIDEYIAEGRKLIEQQAKMNELARPCDCPCGGDEGCPKTCGACELICDLAAIEAAHQEVLQTREKMREIAAKIELLTHGHFNTPTEDVCDPLNEDIRDDEEKVLCSNGGGKMITKQELITRKLNYSRYSFDECITRPEHLEDVLEGKRAGRLPFFGPFIEQEDIPRITKTRSGGAFVNTSDFNWFCCSDSELDE